MVVGELRKLLGRIPSDELLSSVIRRACVTDLAGCGLEVPCEFKFQGDKYSCDWLKEKLKKENFDAAL